eukprot:374126_1
MTTTSNQLFAVETFTLSGISAVITKTVTQPFIRGNLFLQHASAEPYKWTLNRVKFVLSPCGSLWRGNTSNCIRYFPRQGFNFMFKEKIKEHLQINKYDSINKRLSKNIISGSIAGLISLQIFNLLDYTYTRNINISLNSGGFIGLYRRYMISCMAVMIYRGMYFGLYDTLNSLLFDNKTSHFAMSFILSYITTSIASTAVYPVAYIDKRMDSRIIRNNGIIDNVAYIIRKEGISALYKGCKPFGIHNVNGAGTLVVFDLLIGLYKGQLKFSL